MNLILLGPPGAGKGTQAKLMSDRYGSSHISTGDIFRAAIKAGTPLGQEAKAFLDSGALVPDEVAIGIVVNRLDADDCQRGFLLDGFPRTVAQAEALDEHLASRRRPLDAVIDLEVSPEAVIRRLTGRRVCRGCGLPYQMETKPPNVDGCCDRCGGEVYQRDDDQPVTVTERLRVYHEQTQPLIGYYASRGLLLRIDAGGTIARTDESIEGALAAWRGAR